MNGLSNQQQQIPAETLDQVVQMIVAGATEAELLQMGIPQEIIAAAIAQVSQQQAMPQKGMGLAGGYYGMQEKETR